VLPVRLHGDRDETPVAGLGVAEWDSEGAPRTPTAIFEHEEPPAQETVCPGVEHPAHDGVREPEQAQGRREHA